MTNEEVIARLREDDTDFWHCEAADRIEALTEQLEAARADAKEAEREACEIMPEHVIRVASMLIDSLHCLDTEAIQIAAATNASVGIDGVQVLEDAEKIIKAAAGLVATELQRTARNTLAEIEGEKT